MANNIQGTILCHLWLSHLSDLMRKVKSWKFNPVFSMGSESLNLNLKSSKLVLLYNYIQQSDQVLSRVHLKLY